MTKDSLTEDELTPKVPTVFPPAESFACTLRLGKVGVEVPGSAAPPGAAAGDAVPFVDDAYQNRRR